MRRQIMKCLECGWPDYEYRFMVPSRPGRSVAVRCPNCKREGIAFRTQMVWVSGRTARPLVEEGD